VLDLKELISCAWFIEVIIHECKCFFQAKSNLIALPTRLYSLYFGPDSYRIILSLHLLQYTINEVWKICQLEQVLNDWVVI